MNPQGPEYQHKSKSIASPEQNYFAHFAMRYPVYLTTLQISRFIRDFKKYFLASLCSDNELYLRTVHLRTTMPVLAVMLLTNKAIQKRHSAADLIFSGQIYFYLITMGCILMGNIPNFCLSLTENLNVFFATLPFARQFVQCLHLHQGYCKIVLTKVGE